MNDQLPPDSTLRTVKPRLTNAENFVRQAFGLMHSTQQATGPILMRLGITGSGRLPNYRLEQVADGAIIDAIDGNTHKSWPEGSQFEGAKNWSTATMTIGEVRALLGEIRGFRT